MNPRDAGHRDLKLTPGVGITTIALIYGLLLVRKRAPLDELGPGCGATL